MNHYSVCRLGGIYLAVRSEFAKWGVVWSGWASSMGAARDAAVGKVEG